MKKLTIQGFSFFVAVLLLASCGGNQQPQEVQTTSSDNPADLYKPASDNGGIKLAEGFGATLVVDTLGATARHLAINDNGDIYVKLAKLRDGKGIVALRDTNRDGRADLIEGFADYTGTGMALYEGYLYASSDTAVFRYKLKTGDLIPDLQADTIISGFNTQKSHASKPMTFDGNGNIYVTVGAPSNACQEKDRQTGSKAYDPCPELKLQAGIWQFKATQIGQVHGKDGKRYASGIRNAVALDWDKTSNSLYALQHGRDMLNTLFPKDYTDSMNRDLPAEEFLQINDGDDFGWPYCYFDPFQDKKMLAPEYGGDGKKQGRCENIKRPIVTFPAHAAPNDVIFYNGTQFPEKYRNGAFVAFHGSWNRAPFDQEGYFVVFVPFKDGKPDGKWEVFASGFEGASKVKSPSDAVYRPVGLAVAPDGTLYVTDSRKGRIWKIIYYGDKLKSTTAMK
jgi:glucose/arabinose dehydrogenase